MKKTIVIIGGGFAGVDAATALVRRDWLFRRRLPPDWKIVLFSSENHIVFTPLLPEVVGASISPLHVVWPVRQMLPAVDCRTATVTRIDPAAQTVYYELVDGRPASLRYDHLVLACGTEVNMDILPGMAAHGWPLKTLGDAFTLRNHLLGRLEQAEVEIDPEVKKRLLSFVVVGGGFTGVEVAGEINDLLLDACQFYPNINPEDINVYLLHGREHLLPELPQSLGDFAARKLRKRGIKVLLKVRAQAVTASDVRLASGEVIPAGTVVCAIGSSPTALVAGSGLPTEKGWLVAEPDLRVKGYDNIWALGDCAQVPNAYDGQRSPATAQFAVRQAKHLAKNLLAVLKGKNTTPFSYKNRGMFASIGHRTAVGRVMGLKLSGFFAWFLWRGFYLSKMPSIARKLQIALDWFWDLFFPRDIVQLNLEQTRRLRRAHYQPGQFLFHKNDPADSFYIIERGRAGVYLDEKQPPVAVLGPGDHFGERGILGAGLRTASVRAEEPLDVIRIDAGSFQQLVGHFEVLRTRMEGVMRRIQAANDFAESARRDPRLNTTPVRAVMTPNVRTLPADATFGEAAEAARGQCTGSVVVMDNGEMVGICTQTDLHRAASDLKPPSTPLREIMHKGVLCVREDEPLSRAMALFLREPVKRLVVVKEEDPNTPVGVVTPFEIMPFMPESVGEAGREIEKAVGSGVFPKLPDVEALIGPGSSDGKPGRR